MSLQARTSAWDHRLYNVSGDLAHNFQAILTAVAQRLDNKVWPPSTVYIDRQNVSQDELLAVNEAFIQFCRTATQDPKESMEDALRRCSWFDVQEPAHVAYMAHFGLVVAGIMFKRIREAHAAGDPTVTETTSLAEIGDRSHRLMTAPRWVRWLRRFVARVRFAFAR